MKPTISSENVGLSNQAKRLVGPPACVSCKWGTGTACEKPTNTQAQKEMKDKLEQMKQERAKQDAAWFAPPPFAAPTRK